MSDQLSFKEETMFNFLFAKIIELQTDLMGQQLFTKVLVQHLHPDKMKEYELMRKTLEENREIILKEKTETFVAQLKGISNDFDDMLDSLVNPKK